MSKVSERWILGIGLAAVMCVVGGIGYVSRAATGYAPRLPVAPVIGTVDLDEVLKVLHERVAKEKALKDKSEEYKAHLQAVELELKNDQSKYEAEAEGPNKEAMRKAMREKASKANYEGGYDEKLLKEMQGEMLRDLFTKINTAVQAVAKTEGCQLVLTNDEKASVNSDEPGSVLRAISLKRILYADPTLDITSMVSQYMNNQYDAGGATPSSPTPAKKKP